MDSPARATPERPADWVANDVATALSLLLIPFLEGFSTVLMERGIYFYAHRYLHFSGVLNLALAPAFGGAYVAGALSSHHLCRRWGEGRFMRWCLFGQVVFHGGLFLRPTVVGVFVGMTALGLLHGAGYLLATAPLMALCGLGSLRPLLRVRRA